MLKNIRVAAGAPTLAGAGPSYWRADPVTGCAAVHADLLVDSMKGISLRTSINSCLLAAIVTLSGLGVPNLAWAQYEFTIDDYGYVEHSAFFISLGGSYNSINFGSQDIIAIGTSDVTDASGETIATGFAQGPDDATGGTPIDMDSLVSFAPSIEVGYFQHFADSDRWLWGAKFTNDYFGATSNFRVPRLPQVGTFTLVGSTDPIPFTGNAVAVSTHTKIVNQIALRPFIGQSFGRGFVYFGGGPTVTLLRSDVRDLVGFADINGNRGDISGAPQDFSDSAWVWGGAGQVGTTYFLDRGLFLDVSYTYSITGNHTFNFASTFSNTEPDGTTNAGTLVGSTSWQAITQAFGVKIGKTF